MATDNALPLEVLLARLATVVGAEHARELPKGARYGALLPSGLARRARPRAVVTPASAEQIQQLVGQVPRLAHEIWWSPDASGHGAQVGDGRRPAVLLDLSRLARIVEVDRHDGCAVLDAGVSHTALHAHLRERDLPFRCETEANGASAVLGTLLEERWSVGPWGEREAFYCGFEAVLPNGTLLRTGMGALAGSDTWARTRYAYGPALDGLCGHGGLGIVTRYGLWLAPRPRQLLPFAARLADDSAVAQAVEALRPLQLTGTVPGTVGIANERAAAALVVAGGGKAEASSGWRLWGALAGHAQRVAAAANALRAALPALRFGDDAEPANDPAWQARLRLLAGEPLFDDLVGERVAALCFTAVAPPTAADARAQLALVGKRLAQVEPRAELRVGARALLLEVTVESTAKTFATRRAALQSAMNALVDAGYGITRATPLLERAVRMRQADDDQRELARRLRAALDPYAPRRAASSGVARRRSS